MADGQGALTHHTTNEVRSIQASGEAVVHVGNVISYYGRDSHPPTNTKATSFIPFSRDSDFVSRGDILEQIDQRCSKPAGRVALVGLSGVGKSQLAIEFAHRFAEAHPDVWVFWVHAGTQARVEDGFRTIADAVKLAGWDSPKADVPLLVHRWLSDERNGRWIMVLDSADDLEVFYGARVGGDDRQPLATFLPQSRNGSIVVTTCKNDLAYRLTGNRKNMIEIGPMSPTDAITLLETKLGSLSDMNAAATLVERLDHIPLAISQAAAYIQARAPRSSIKKYLAEFLESERKRTALLEHDAGDLRRDGGASNAPFTTWQISFNDIRSERSSAADLLSLMSFFDRQGIPESVLMFSKGPQAIKRANSQGEDRNLESGGNNGNDSDKESDESTDSDSTNSGFEDDVTMLRNYCLINTIDGADGFEMHGLVQLATRKWLRVHGQQEKFKQQYIERMAASFPTGNYENWTTCQKLFTHVQLALDYKPTKDCVDEWASLLYKGGWYAWLQGRYNVAEQMASKSLKAREKKLGIDNLKTLASTSLFAYVLLDLGRWGEAQKLFIQLMETCQTKLGADHPDTLTSKSNLASTYRNQGRWDEAEKLEVQVMETRKAKLGVDYPDTLISMANLASTYRNQGRWDEAEKLDVQVMETSKTKLGVDHPDTLTSMGNLASTYRNQGRWGEAEKLFIQVIETLKIKLGADHPDTLTSISNLASTYRNQGRWNEAEKLEVQVMETSKTKLGVDHLDTLMSMSNLASTLWKQGRWDEAEKLDVQVMETRKTKLGIDHPDTLTSIANHASTLWKQGRWDEAEKLEVQVMEASKTKLGIDHPDTLTIMYNLAITWRYQGRHIEALALMEDCALARQRRLGPEHPDTLLSVAAITEWS